MENSSDVTDVVEEFARQIEQVCAISSPSVDDDDDPNEGLTDNGGEWGYQPLAQDDNEEEHVPDDDHEEEEPVVPEPPTLTIDKDQELSEDTANTIRSIMSNIKLPDSAVPEWAKAIPESMWMPRVIQQQQQQDDSNKE